ncbi:hypothetical protein [Actinacidiphila acidipaludis]|uniref:Uncharacterized protein n=1 Tax=Actinacidiphila acidipaludis TaxID=2873382 RepID=A0ABS7PZH3_9ACTN|nr:hypothetical protein [Streptomyces acidipaludis]MBY8876138.1 hypothetical protein [Streptomyces acidipaludis]
MIHRISALASVVGVVVGVMLLVIGIRDYRAGASALWPVLGTAVLLSAVYRLVLDVRDLRAGPDA